jgi:hypothetical protein
LRVVSHQHNNLRRDIDIQAGEVAKVGEGEVTKVHAEIG